MLFKIKTEELCLYRRAKAHGYKAAEKATYKIYRKLGSTTKFWNRCVLIVKSSKFLKKRRALKMCNGSLESIRAKWLWNRLEKIHQNNHSTCFEKYTTLISMSLRRFHGVMAAHWTLNPKIRVRISVEPGFFFGMTLKKVGTLRPYLF